MNKLLFPLIALVLLLTSLHAAAQGQPKHPDTARSTTTAPSPASSKAATADTAQSTTRSIMAGFRTLVVIVCSLAGLFTGAIGLYLIRGIFNLHWKTKPALLTGASGGLIGGLVLGWILFYVIRKFLQFCRQRLA